MSLGEYELTGRLGGGGMSDVYRAWQPKLAREVAVKVLLPELAGEPAYVERFVREARMIAQLQHANIVPIFDYGTANDWTYLVMPFLRGGTLVERILRQGEHGMVLSALPAIADFLTALAGALDYAHAESIVHCDIKPGNVLFDEHGLPLLADFGIAMMLGSRTQEHERRQFLAGSYSYMSPELWQGEPVTPWVDQYALGLVIYALVTGHAPFGAELSSVTALMHKHLHDMPVPVHFLRNEASSEVNEVIMRAIAKKPTDRFPTVLAFAEAFKQAATDGFHDENRRHLMSDYNKNNGKENTPSWASMPTRVTRHAPARVSRTSLAHMITPTARIFLSYRRTDSSIMTGRIYDRLIETFGPDMVFRDLDSIPLGTNFKDYLENVVRGCVVELVMIGKDWLEAKDDAARRRLDNPDDFVRVEIEAALRLDIPLIPVLIDGARMPGREALPPSLGELVYCNGANVRSDPDFHTDMERLIRALEYLLRAR